MQKLARRRVVEISAKVTEGRVTFYVFTLCGAEPDSKLVWGRLRVVAPAPVKKTVASSKKDKIGLPWMSSVEQDEGESSGSSIKTIIIVLVIIVVVVAIAVTGYAYQKKILCFEQSSDDDDDEEATGESPLLKQTTSASKVSHSRTTSATTLNKSRPSGTSVSRSTTYGHR